MTTRVAEVVAVLVATAVAACGVPPEDSAREIPPPRDPYRASASHAPVTSVTGTVPEKLYLIDSGTLVVVTRRVPAKPTIDALFRDLLAGPTDTERDRGLTSALLGSSVIAAVHVDNREAVVELAAGLDDTGRTDEVLAIAQIVCTLTTRPEITGVSFTRDGQPIGVPRDDGSLSQGPLTAADYRSLVTGE